MAIILPGGFNITNNEPVDARITLADQTARYALSSANVYEGLIVFQQDNNTIWVLTDTSNVGNSNGWTQLQIGSVSSNLPDGVVSGSSQLTASYDGRYVQTGSFNTFTSSYITDSSSFNNRLDQLSTASGSAITRLTALETETSNLESFSASTLTRLSNLEGTDITITLTGDVTGTGTITNLGNVSFATTVAANQVALGTDTTGDYVASLVQGTGVTITNNSGEGATPTIGLTNNAITIAGTSVSLGGSITAATILNGTNVISSSTQLLSVLPSGVVSGSSQVDLTATTNYASGILTRLNVVGVVSGSSQINLGSATGNITLATQTTGDYVASLVQGTGVTITNNSGENATPTIAIGQAVGTSANVQFNSIGVGTTASGTAGEIRATGDITAFHSSDIRLKENIVPISNALEKVKQISGNTYDWKEGYDEVHSHKGNDVGVIAQEIEQILPQIVTNRDNGFKAVQYEKIIPLLIEAIKELSAKIDSFENK